MSLPKKQDPLTKQINAKYREVEGLARSTVEGAIELGGMLTEKKAELPHGEFGAWVREHFAGSERHAQRFMKLYRERDELAAKTTSMSDLSLTGALDAIAAPKEDDGMMSREELEERTARIHEHIGKAEDALKKSREAEKEQYEAMIAYARHPDAAKDPEATRKFLLGLLEHTVSHAGHYLIVWLSSVRRELGEHLEPLAAASKNGAMGAMLERIKERTKGHESDPISYEEQQLAKDVCPETLELFEEQREELRRWIKFYQRIERAGDTEAMVKVLEDLEKKRDDETLAPGGVAILRLDKEERGR